MKKIQNNHTFRPPRPGMLSPTIPAQPPESAWKFTQELRQPLHNAPIIWERRTPRAGEVDLRKGVTLDFLFPDPHGNLATMHADFRRFLKMASIPIGGAYRIATEQIKTRRPESFTLDVTSAQCRILAGDTEGIRRGLIFWKMNCCAMPALSSSPADTANTGDPQPHFAPFLRAD